MQVFRVAVIRLAVPVIVTRRVFLILTVGAIKFVCGMTGGCRLRHMHEGIDMTKYRHIGYRAVESAFRIANSERYAPIGEFRRVRTDRRVPIDGILERVVPDSGDSVANRTPLH